MIEMMVELVWKKEKVHNASFRGIQFWTKISGNYLVDQNEAIGVDLLDLGVFEEGLYGGLITEFLEQEKLGLQLKLKNRAELKRTSFTQKFQNTKMVFFHKSDL